MLTPNSGGMYNFAFVRQTSPNAAPSPVSAEAPLNWSDAVRNIASFTVVCVLLIATVGMFIGSSVLKRASQLWEELWRAVS